ncbi:MAG TPA: hypothetical protein VFW17_17225 [Ktedonobacterales bacterium]|nr:hypothetical protein [Ktedonobacterales bacterium]
MSKPGRQENWSLPVTGGGADGGADGSGLNRLGTTLMEVRARLRHADS